ncbi:MAG: 50S ribosomal protein L11 methyltransferase [Fimbriimonadaceae bacterium]|nr:50S ribosomal protein L11 methyltransferase [Fimbriimonadaceae bacterium]
MRWIRVRALFDSTPPDWSSIAFVFAQSGCDGTEVLDRPPSMVGYVPVVPGWETRVSNLAVSLKSAGTSEIRIATVEEEDWAESWKAHFPPMRIGRHWVVRPSWETEVLEPGDRELVLDPGQAFGTGDHPTTRMCLRLLEGLPLEGRTVLDVGCGSGILSIAAAKAGAASVLGVDIEPGAVEVARRNAAVNGVTLELREQDALGEAEDGVRWDVILSNIISATLIRMAPLVGSRLSPGGVWIVSGIIRSNWADVHETALRSGMRLEERVEEGEWVGAQFRGSGTGVG